MNRTIAYYDKHAKEFCEETIDADMSYCREKFMQYLPSSAHILDAGCGSGRDSKAFIEAGYNVTSIDASMEICKEAEKLLKQQVLCLSFEELNYLNEFDGIWACASLVHVPRDEISSVLQKLRNSLKDDGIIYASFKYGQGEKWRQGRFYNDYDEESIKTLWNGQGFSVLELFITGDVRDGREDEKWVNIIARKSL